MACEAERDRWIEEHVSYQDTEEKLTEALISLQSCENEHNKLVEDVSEILNSDRPFQKKMGLLDEKRGEDSAVKGDIEYYKDEIVGLRNGLNSLKISMDNYFQKYFDCRKKCS